MSCSRTQQSDSRGSCTRGHRVLSQALYQWAPENPGFKKFNDSRCEVHWVCPLIFIGYFTGFSVEMLWYLDLTYWVGLDIIAIYENLWKIDKSKSNTIWAIMWENDSLRNFFHYHRNRKVWFYRVMLLIFNSFYLTELFKSWSEIWHIYPFNVIATKDVAKVVYSILTRKYCSTNFSLAWNRLTNLKKILLKGKSSISTFHPICRKYLIYSRGFVFAIVTTKRYTKEYKA